MVTINVQFEGESGMVKKKAMLTDDLKGLSTSKANQCTDIIDDFRFSDGFWSLLFEGDNGLYYELKLAYDTDNNCKTFEPLEVLIWSDGVIMDSSDATLKVKQ